jgi:transcriptional regulator with GAF, ATPase, and Fis domain
LESPQELRKRFCQNPDSFYDTDYIVLQEEILHDEERRFLDSLDQYYKEVQLDGKTAKQVLILHLKGDYYYHKGQFTEAMVCYESAAEMAKTGGARLAEATINQALIGAYLNRQKWIRLDELFERNDKIYEELDLVSEKINIMLQSSLFNQFCGCLEESAKIIKSIYHLNEMISKTPIRTDYLQNRVLIFLAKANIEKKLGHYLKAVEYCQQVEGLLKEFIFENQNVEELAWYQSIILVLKTECYLDLGYNEKSNKMIQKLERLSEKFPNVVAPLKAGILRAEFEFQFNNFPLGVDEWLTQLKDSFSAGETEFCLEQFLRILRQFHKNYPISHYEKLLGYYESLLRLCDRKLPVKARRDFHAYYSFNPHHRIKISPHHMMIKFVEISRELMGEYHVPTLARKVLQTMVDFTQMQRGILIIGTDEPEVVATHQIRGKALSESGTEESLCLRLARFATLTGRTLNIPDLSAVSLNEEVVSEEYQTERWNELKAKSVVVIPFLLDDRVMGAAYLDGRSRRPVRNDDEIAFLENFAMNVAIALNNASCFARKDEDLMRVQRELAEQRNQLIHQFAINNFIGISEKTRELLQVVGKISDSAATVLLTGESGVGKELISKTIHYNSSRRQKPFVAINCGAIPEHLLESELFGHEKGSFTDAHESKIGLFEQAHEGTIFLDEIGELPANMQVKILRVLEEGEVLPVGARAPRKINARVICATNRNLEDMVRVGTFRQDLFFRINVINIKVPSLRERKADIPLLIRHTLKMYAEENDAPVKAISADALNYLMNYPWPGNVRELVNVMNNLAIFVESPRIELDDILKRPELFHVAADEDEKEVEDPILKLSGRIEQGELSLSAAKQEFEKLQILRALRMSSGHITTASGMLHMPRPQVSRLIKKYNLKEDDDYGDWWQ